jgi:hypothetical protein
MHAKWLGICVAGLVASCSGDKDDARGISRAGGRNACFQNCLQAGAECGASPDRCGGVLECGYCRLGTFCGGAGPNKCGDGPCQKRDCAPGECGLVPDGCSEMMDCGGCQNGRTCQRNRCLCLDDRFEPNPQSRPTDLGSYTDTSRHSQWWQGLNLKGPDEDWFSVRVIDDFNFSNPKVSFSAYATNPDLVLELTVFFHCDSGGDRHSCSDSEPLPDRTGCIASYRGGTRRWVGLRANCWGLSDNGIALVRVRRQPGPTPVSIDACDGYDLGFAIE